MSKKHKKHHKAEKKSVEESPLKLVLKVPSGTDNEQSPAYPPPDADERHKKHKKKKKKHKHHHEERREEKRERTPKRNVPTSSSEIDVTDIPDEPPLKKMFFDDSLLKRLREPRSCTVGKADSGTLKACLDFLQRTLHRKDSQGFFASPVNDLIAPGYSSIISHPMDFSTMQKRIDNNHYDNVMEYKRDYKLMCDNAMTYNSPDTVYYKVAQKLLESGMKMMSKDRLLQLKNTLSVISTITEDELGLEYDFDDGTYSKPKQPREKKIKPKVVNEKFEPIPDNLSAKEILTQAEAAAGEAHAELTLRQPNSRLGFLRRREDGSTTLNIINPDNDGVVNETERVVTIGQTVGNVKSGTGSIAGFKEDKRNKVTPITYLQYGPFGSYAPQYDSSFSNLSKEDSDILLSTYGNETGVAYSKSLESFVSDTSDFVIKMVDNMLDILTGGEHTKTQAVLEEKKKAEERKNQMDKEISDKAETATLKREQCNIVYSDLRSLSELGIDTTFLDQFEKKEKQKKKHDEVQEQLDQTSDLIHDLHRVHNERLSKKPPQHLAHLQGPTDAEMQLAHKVTDSLKEAVKQVTPSDVVSAPSVRSAIGVVEPPAMEEDDPEDEVAARINKELQDILNAQAKEREREQIDTS